MRYPLFIPTSLEEYQDLRPQRLPRHELCTRGVLSLYAELTNGSFGYAHATVGNITPGLPSATLACRLSSDVLDWEEHEFRMNARHRLLSNELLQEGFFYYPDPEIVRRIITNNMPDSQHYA